MNQADRIAAWEAHATLREERRLTRALPPRAQELVDAFHKHANDVLTKPTVRADARALYDRTWIDVLDTTKFRARAAKHNDVYIVAVSLGAILAIAQTMTAFMRDSRFCASYGKSDPGERVAETFENGLMPYVLSAHEEDLLAPPSDRARNTLRDYMIVFALQFVIDHELAHIRCGHIDYLSLPGSSSSIHEELQLTGSTEVRKLRRLMEAEADVEAAFASARPMLFDRFPILLSKGPPPQFIPNIGVMVQFWTAAVTLLFHLIAEVEPQSALDSDRPHPHPAVRMAVSIAPLVGSLVSGLKGSAEHLINNAMESWKQTAMALDGLHAKKNPYITAVLNMQEVWSQADDLRRGITNDLQPVVASFAPAASPSAEEYFKAHQKSPWLLPPGPTLPTVRELLALPRWAMVAWAARCARRVQPVLSEVWPDRSQTILAAVDRAIELAESSAAKAQADPGLASASFRAMCERLDDPRVVAVAGTASSAAMIAVPSAMPGRHQQAAQIAAGALGVTNDDATKLAIAASMRKDYLLLAETANTQRWTHDTAVPPSFFGPIWQDGTPAGWSAGSTG